MLSSCRIPGGGGTCEDWFDIAIPEQPNEYGFNCQDSCHETVGEPPGYCLHCRCTGGSDFSSSAFLGIAFTRCDPWGPLQLGAHKAFWCTGSRVGLVLGRRLGYRLCFVAASF